MRRDTGAVVGSSGTAEMLARATVFMLGLSRFRYRV
jgi:hypothetical protein